MNAGFNHNWDPYWSSGLYGAYAAVHYGSGAKTLVCNTPGIGFYSQLAANGGGVTVCNPNYSISQVGVVTRWTPVKNLTFSGDLAWSHIDQQFSGTIASSSASIGKPSATYELKSQSNVTLLLRAQRDF
jgi:Porin subfamily